MLPIPDDRLLVGNENRDDAAVYDMGDGTAIISTTDFFMPIVDDPFTFGRIAAANAISDVYAMGGKPLLAIAILGWPVEKLPAEVAREVLEGGRSVCKEACIQLAGGHSIDSPEPIFGLAVTGQVNVSSLKRNDTATEGSRLYLTKPLGVAILSTAQKHGKLKPEHHITATESMCKLNTIGLDLAKIEGVSAMTDVTGFGLLGHLVEMCDGSQLSACISYEKIPVIPGIQSYISEKCIPGGTHRNWDSYGHHVALAEAAQKLIMCDPQTSGGLLIAVEPKAEMVVHEILNDHKIETTAFGSLIKQEDKLVRVQ